MSTPTTVSAHGAEIPVMGFGTSGLGKSAAEIVAIALRLGYRHIDTARKYGTERGVGDGIRASGVPREEIFLTTKVSHESLRPADFARSVETSLSELQVDYVDLLLIHWPNPQIPVARVHGAARRRKARGPRPPRRRRQFHREAPGRGDPRLPRSRSSPIRSSAIPISTRPR